MSSYFLYNNENLEDEIHVLAFINNFTKELGVEAVHLDVNTIGRIVKGCKLDFPHDGGVQKASAFKQVANFVCHFVGEHPIVTKFPAHIIGNELARIDNHQNAMVAFALAEEALNKSKIERKDGIIDIANALEYSRHSYVDIIDALANISPVNHFRLVTVLLEQMVYKSNPGCQYKTNGNGSN